jgi:hypothetical protein
MPAPARPVAEDTGFPSVFSICWEKLKESPRRRRKALQLPSHHLWLRRLLPLLLKLARQFKTGCNIFWNNLSFKTCLFWLCNLLSGEYLFNSRSEMRLRALYGKLCLSLSCIFWRLLHFWFL